MFRSLSRSTWINTSEKTETQLRKITEQAICLRKATPSMGSLTYRILIGLGLRDPKYTPDNGNYPTYNNHSSLPDMLYSLKSFKCMFSATNHQPNHLPKTGMPVKE